MNQHDNLTQQIQLLIDNELNAQQTTLLLQNCEGNLAAWRTLALGMLEARELKAGLSELLKTTGSIQLSAAEHVHTRQNHRWLWHGFVACLAVATFVVGLSVPRKTQSPTTLVSSSDQPITRTDSNGSNPEVFDSAVVSMNSINDPADVSAVVESDDADSQAAMAVVGYAQILHQVGSEPPIPVITGPGLDYSALLTQQRHIPEAIARQYRNEGMVVENQRRVMSLTLADGQQFAIPLDQLGVRYVGNELL